MPKFHVTYYYLATGMEGKADVRDCGTIDAPTAEDATRQIAMQRFGTTNNRDLEWVIGCLSAKRVTS